MRLPDRILVLAPHPDDEVLMAAGVIRRAVGQGAKVSVCIVTNGDYLCPDQSKGGRRLSESLEALGLLGLGQEDVFFLGYPDTGFEPEVSFLSKLYADSNGQRVHASACGSQTYAIPGGKQDFHLERLGEHAAYCKDAFAADLEALLRLTEPELVITSSRMDMHGDHAALSLFVRDLLGFMPERGRPMVWESLIHSPAGDDLWPKPDAPYEAFTCPPGFEDALRWEERVRGPLPLEMLEGSPEQHLKLRALQCHRTALKPQEEPEVVRYLMAFAKNEEIFWPIEPSM
jgi:LmbE family N-acetylglucosaminyl deacetylase